MTTGPVQHMCEFPECGDQASRRRTPPGSAGMWGRIDVWVCWPHDDAAPAMLAAKIEARDREASLAYWAKAALNDGRLV